MRKGLTLLVFLATLLGAGFGLACHELIRDPGTMAAVTQGLSLITTIFLRAVKMLVAPLVLATLISGVGRMENADSRMLAGSKPAWRNLETACQAVQAAGARLTFTWPMASTPWRYHRGA